MKKIYLLAFTLAAFAFSTSAQVIIDDNMEYAEGPLHYAHWSNWSGVPGPEDIYITEEYARSGDFSGMIGGDGVQDAILKLGNRTSGQYTLGWYMYIPAGKGGYLNFQENEVPGEGAWGLNIYFNPNNEWQGMGFVFDDSNPAVQVSDAFDYPEDGWFNINFDIDLDTDSVVMTVNDVEVYAGPFYTGSNLGGVDFYSIDANSEVYIDDVLFAEGSVGVEDFATESFSVYPNPVKDLLTIQTKTAVDQVVIYDILGKIVMAVNPEVISPKIDMSTLSSGAYLVKVTIGNSSKTVKVLK